MTWINVDCNYLMGRDPNSGAATNALIGLYATGYTNFVCDVQTVTESNGRIKYSALYLRWVHRPHCPFHIAPRSRVTGLKARALD
jgi:hypothetical protein